MAGVESNVVIREADEADIEAVVALASAALGWRPEEPNEALFRWKHLENPAGVSPMWVAELDGTMAGFRTFLRWRFRRPGIADPVEAVRAVDTATHPDFQGRGIFSTLTRHAVGALSDTGAGFVFNTPNAQSRPGYLKMGWVEAGVGSDRGPGATPMAVAWSPGRRREVVAAHRNGLAGHRRRRWLRDAGRRADRHRSHP